MLNEKKKMFLSKIYLVKTFCQNTAQNLSSQNTPRQNIFPDLFSPTPTHPDLIYGIYFNVNP
jgi:hypothetical protein